MCYQERSNEGQIGGLDITKYKKLYFIKDVHLRLNL